MTEQQQPDWRLRDAEAYEAKARRLKFLIDDLEDVHALFEADSDAGAATELRSVMALVQSRAHDHAQRAVQLRAEARDRPKPITLRAVRSS